ncbi:TM0106 family RecB-like putative nuclease [Sphingomonas morindae]|uniref:TM0106 family RecB-like putative nuclease n=1 Tax=Sphingomonas morindae TaxID=1541170 RepID=A0ABY4XAD4_9SPHN|nr:TM0106 family RecB-like putative nuclease [Sphingomonas morindae]USI73932.1 TM0106 family RecB-like putative nuclease [Sphingomonas morindae]
MSEPMPLISGAMLRDILLCERKAALDIHGDQARRDPISAFVRLLWAEGAAHEEDLLGSDGGGVVDLRGLDRAAREAGTIAAIQSRAPTIYGSVILHDDLIGMPDILALSSNGYVASDVKSGAATEEPNGAYKKEYLVQVAHYAFMLRELGVGAGEEAGIIDRKGEAVWYDLRLPLGRERITGLELHLRTLDRAREIRASPSNSRGALGARCGMCEWKTLCRAELRAADDLTLIPGLGRAIRPPIETLATTVADLAAMPTSAIRSVPGVGIDRMRRFVDRARLLANPHAGPIIREPLSLSRPPHAIDFDIEADPLRDIIYLHGFWHCSEGRERFVHFFAETADEAGEREAFASAVSHFREHRTAHWFHYSAYERTAYRKLQRRYPDVCDADEIEDIFAPVRCTDVYAVIAKRTDWPLSSYGIKSIARACGFKWEDTDPGGANSIEWYDRYVQTGDRALRDRIIAYNRDDVIASQVVRDALFELETTGAITSFKRPAK